MTHSAAHEDQAQNWSKSPGGEGLLPRPGEHQQEEAAYSHIWNLVGKACRNFVILVLTLNVHNFFSMVFGT